jgi:hypothetical protein
MKDITVLREDGAVGVAGVRQERDAINCIVTDTGVLGLSAEILRFAQDDNAISG